MDQVLAQQTVYKEEGSLKTRKSENSSLLSYLLSSENFFKVNFSINSKIPKNI